jgi:hypothetical protein
MVNYGNGKVYKIWSPMGDKIYIGSTTKEHLSQRMTAHRGSYKTWKNGKGRYVSSFELFEEYGIDTCTIVLLEVFPCGSKDELHMKEAHHIKSLSCVNKRVPYRTEDEKEKHKEHQKRKTKKWYYEHTDKEHQRRLLFEVASEMENKKIMDSFKSCDALASGVLS